MTLRPLEPPRPPLWKRRRWPSIQAILVFGAAVLIVVIALGRTIR